MTQLLERFFSCLYDFSGLELRDFHFWLVYFLLVQLNLLLQPYHFKVCVCRFYARFIILATSDEFEFALEFRYFILVGYYSILSFGDDLLVVLSSGLTFLGVGCWHHAFGCVFRLFRSVFRLFRSGLLFGDDRFARALSHLLIINNFLRNEMLVQANNVRT